MKSVRTSILTVVAMLWTMTCTVPSASAQTEGGQADSIPALTTPADSVQAEPERIDSVLNQAQGRNRPVRKITPVDVDDQKREPVLHYYDKHGELLDEPVLFLATLDTVTKTKSKPIYPKFNGVSVGVNFADAIMMAFGQKFGSYDVWADVSLWNWLFPVVEAGIGYADATPENKNFTYKVSPSFYCKLGVNYNFLYKSNPDYQLYLGLRAGMSNFGWSARNVTVNSDYWQESQKFNLTGMRSTAFWGEVLAGIKVKIVGGFSLGWNVRWRVPFSIGKAKPDGLPDGMEALRISKPWFIPGYGGHSAITFNVSAIWTFGGKSKADIDRQAEAEAKASEAEGAAIKAVDSKPEQE